MTPLEEKKTAASEAEATNEKVPYRTAFYYLLGFLAIAFVFFAGVCFINSRKAAAALRYSALTELALPETSAPVQEPATVNAAGKINVNTADAALLETLPGIGEAKAKKIIEYRNYYGVITQGSDLLKIDGIGESTLAQILPYITFTDEP